MNELSADLQEKAENFISEVNKFTSPFGTFYASLTNGNHYVNWIKICFTGCGVTECFRLAIEDIRHEENIPQLARYCVRDVLRNAVIGRISQMS